MQIVDGEMAVAEAFALDAEAARTPDAGADEDRFVAVIEECVKCQCATDTGIRADVDAELGQFLLIAVEDGLRQAEIRMP